MNYILITLLFILNQNDASEDAQSRRIISDSFNVNIGAGYAVGVDHSSNKNPPTGTSNITLSKNYYPRPLKAETVPHASLRGPRILGNFTPQVANPISEISRNRAESQNVPGSRYKEHYSASASNIQSYSSPSFESSSDEDLSQPNLVDFQKILNQVESRKPYSKILQVIKVPAIYEIHFQADADNSKSKVNFNPTGELFWKNYNENNPDIIQSSEDYKKWFDNAHSDKEPHFSKDGEKYYDFSDTPVVTYEHVHEPLSFDGRPEENNVLQPTISHHYSNTRTFPFNNGKDVRINYSSEAFKKPTWPNRDYPPNKRQPYTVNNFKRHIVSNNTPRRPNPTGPLLQNEILNGRVSNVKDAIPFKHNQDITENNKPQALHEVPAPILGKHPQPKPFEIQKQSDPYPKLLPTPSTVYKQTKVKFNKLSPPNTKPANYNTNWFLDSKPSASLGKKNLVTKPETSFKDSANLIYGKKTSEHVLTPYEINIPVTPGSTMVTVAENPYGSHKNYVQNFHYLPDVKRNVNHISSEKPEGLHTFNDHYKQVADIRQQKPMEVVKDFQSHANINNNIFGESQISENYYKGITDVSQTRTISAGQNNIENVKYTGGVDSIGLKKPVILDNKFNNYFQEVATLPYQTQRSISAENIQSTTPGSGTILFNGNNLETTTNRPIEVSISQLEQTTKKVIDSNMNTKEAFSEVAAPTFSSSQNLRRRVFSTDYNMNHKKKGYMNNGYLKKSHSRISQRKGNGPYPDSIIYITRKSTV